MMIIKNYISDLIKYNKKLLLIIFFIILAIIIGILFINRKDNNDSEIDEPIIKELILAGSDVITLKQGEEYVEPGYYIIDKDGNLRNDEVSINLNNLDTTKIGTYIIQYCVGDKFRERKVIVTESVGKLTLDLNGSEKILLNINEEYVELGFTASDSILGDITNKVKVTGEVNTSVKGVYELIYEVENGSEKVTKKRIVVVGSELDVLITSNNLNSYTNSSITLDIVVEGNNFSYIKYPDNRVSKEKKTNYVINENGVYTFYVYSNDLNYITKEIEITNIDKVKPSGSCSVVKKDNTLSYTVYATDSLSGIKEYKYYGDNKLLSTSDTYSYKVNKSYSNAHVDVIDKSGNIASINCEINEEVEPIKNDYLEMHFIISGHNDDAILIRTGLTTLLIDGGRIGCASDIIPYIETLGVKTFDAIIGSHVHYNHVQAQSKIIEKFNVKSAYYPVDLNTCVKNKYCESDDVKYIKDAINNNNIKMNIMNPGDLITIKDVSLYVIGPKELRSGTDPQNYNSSIFILKYKNNTFMFTGDAPSSVFSLNKIKSYADKLNISLDVDMIKYPHHGNTTIETDILNASKPKYVIIPNYNYGQYPSSENKNKITKVGAKIYQMATDGNIVLISDGNNIEIKIKQKAETYKR